MNIQKHENREFLEDLIAKASEAGIELEIYQFIDTDHQLCYWYGGDLAVATKDNIKLTISAKGDIDASLYDGACPENEENLVEWSRDKTNGGGFYSDMKRHIRSDEVLTSLKDAGLLEFNNNNWFEWEAFDMEAKEYVGPDALDNIFDEDYLEECLSVDTLESIFEYIEEWKGD